MKLNIFFYLFRKAKNKWFSLFLFKFQFGIGLEQVEIHESNTFNSELPYEQVLEIRSVDYKYVGYFHCVKNETDENEEHNGLVEPDDASKASKIYLFVEGNSSMEILKNVQLFFTVHTFYSDPQHPLVEDVIPIVEGNQHQSVLIPCKPTSKRWDIKLIKEGDEVNRSSCVSNIVDWKLFSF